MDYFKIKYFCKIYFTRTFFIFLIIISTKICAQVSDDNLKTLYKLGIEALQNNEIEKAIVFFQKSIEENSDVKSYYQLAKIYFNKNTLADKEKAHHLLNNALLKSPNNLDCLLLRTSLIKDSFPFNAIEEYKKIIKIDSTSFQAWFNLGKLKAEAFNDYHGSIREIGAVVSMEAFAQRDFNEAVYALNKAVKFDTGEQASLQLASLYENAEMFNKGIELLNKLELKKPNVTDIHLYLGLLYYENSQNQNSYNEFQKALTIMPPQEKKDYTFTSVVKMLSPNFDKKFSLMSEQQIKDFITSYWEISDPLYLTNYNERLLEHYSRVTFANMRFSVPALNLKGWDTDRGEIYLRYGKPLSWKKLRPYLKDNKNITLETEVWYYKNKTFGFTDYNQKNNFKFNVPKTSIDKFETQFQDDTEKLIENLRKIDPEEYVPKFDGPTFSIPYLTTQFQNLDNKKNTDIYVNFGLKNETLNNLNKNSYECGIFLFNNYYKLLYEQRKLIKRLVLNHNINISEVEKLNINSLKMSDKRDSGYFSFEIIRNLDKGVFTNKGKLKIINFNTDSLKMSNVLLASKVTQENSNLGSILRNNINILPNPTGIFTKENPLYIYYEVYNLKKDKNELTNFEQEITIKKVDESSGITKAINSILDVIGISKEGDQITLSTNYQTKDENSQIYFQLDMNKYEYGDYVLTTTITDNISGNKTSQEALIKWR